MTTEEYVAKLESAYNEFTKGKWFDDLVRDTHAEHVKGIFVEGIGGNEKIGKYSTKQMLASESQFIVKSKFKQSIAASGISFSSSVKTRKTKAKREKALDKKLWIKFKKAKKAVPIMILENGYKEFREIQGREANFVNLNLTGDLFRDFSSTLSKINGVWYTGVKRKLNSNKIDWMIEKYGKNTFNFQPKTRKSFLDAVSKKYQELFKDLK